MLVSAYVNGFGQSFGATSLLQLIEVAQERSRIRDGFGIRQNRGFGAATADFSTFVNGGKTATFVSADKVVYCRKDDGNRPVCMANTSAAKSTTAPAAMQRATDRLLNLTPVATELAGREMRGQVPSGDGTTYEKTFPIPQDLGTSPIGRRSGYDGLIGASTIGLTTAALTMAGILKAFPNPGISMAFVSTAREDIYTQYAQEIADYLNDVANNFNSLLAAYKERGGTSVQSKLDAETIPFVVPLAAEKRSIAPIIVAGAAMIGITTIAALSAGKHKPDFLYTAPALGRGRRHRNRSW